MAIWRNRGADIPQPEAIHLIFPGTVVLKVIAAIRVLAFLAAVFVCASFAMAQTDDWHLSQGGAKVFFTRSTFAHGYMHGYEEGFHRGDLDLQMARPFAPVKMQPKYKKICGYHYEFGDRSSFEDGYRKGYTVGYNDAFSGRDFRAIQLLEQARSAKSLDKAALPDPGFDRAFVAGYEKGQKAGLQDGRSAAAVGALDSIDCGSVPSKMKKPANDDCEAYQGGYRLGYSDGYTNQHENGQVFARK